MNIFRRLTSVSLFVMFLLSCSSLSAHDGSITFGKDNSTIYAPEGKEYTWYLNGNLLSEEERTLKINSPGTYVVITKKKNGESITSKITLGISSDGKVYKVYLIGDSTVSEYGSGWYPLTGWGMMLPYFFDSNVVIHNEALGGRSAKSFYNDHWAPIRDDLSSGDFVFIQFGINDAKKDDPSRYSEPFTTFKDYLTNFVNETKARGAFPVLVSTVRRNSWVDKNTLYDAWHDYPVATRQLAGELGIPLIDLDKLSVGLYQGLGPDYVGPFFYMNLDPGEYPKHPDGYSDDVHFQETGAIEMARLVVEAIKGYNSDTTINKLIPHIKPMFEVSTSTNFPNGAIITRSTSYPEGIPVTLKAKLKQGFDLVEWKNGAGESIGTADLIKFTMGTEALNITAVLDDNPVPDCAGELNGSAYIDNCGKCVEGTTGYLPCNSNTKPGIYKLTSLRSALCVQDGDEITQQDCNNEKSQFWEFIKEGFYYKIKNYNSGEYLQPEDIIPLSKLSSGENEMLWRLEKTGADTFSIVPKDSLNLKLEVFGFSGAGAYLRLYGRHSGANQSFILWESDPQNCSEYPCLTSINQSFANEVKFVVHPNPTSNYAVVELFPTSDRKVSLEIYNMQGKKVFGKSDILDNTIEIGHSLSNGMYVVKIQLDHSYTTFRFVKN